MNTNFIIHMIGKINEKSNRFLSEELKKKGLEGVSPSHGDIIGALCLVDYLQMKELSELINRDKSTVTSLVNKLVALGYVEKKKDPADHRVTQICLSQKGESVKPDVMEISNKLRSKAYKGLSDEDRIKIMDLLIKIYKNFN